MSTRRPQSPPVSDERDQASVDCPFCDYGKLGPSPNGNHLTCGECRRKVYEVQVPAHRMRLLLNAFDELSNQSYDKELLMCTGEAWDEILGELAARGFAWPDEKARPSPDLDPELVISEVQVKDYKLSATALRALNEMQRDYEFEDGPTFMESVMDALRYLGKPTADQRRLRRQLEAMSSAAREFLSLAIQKG